MKPAEHRKQKPGLKQLIVKLLGSHYLWEGRLRLNFNFHTTPNGCLLPAHRAPRGGRWMMDVVFEDRSDARGILGALKRTGPILGTVTSTNRWCLSEVSMAALILNKTMRLSLLFWFNLPNLIFRGVSLLIRWGTQSLDQTIKTFNLMLISQTLSMTKCKRNCWTSREARYLRSEWLLVCWFPFE